MANRLWFENISCLGKFSRNFLLWKSDFLDFLGQKTDFLGKKRTNLGAFFQKCPLSDQGLIKQTYLAALLSGNSIPSIPFQNSPCSRFRHFYTLNSTFEDRGKMAVNSQKHENWISIQRKRRINCQFEERVNKPPMIIDPTSLFKKKGIKLSSLNILLPLLSFSFFERHSLGGGILLVGWLTLLLINWQPIRPFFELASFSEFKDNSPLSSNVISSVY